MESLNQDTLFLWLAADHSLRFERQGQVFERYQESAIPADTSRLRIIYQDTSAQVSLSAWIALLAQSSHVIGISDIERQVGLHCIELALVSPLSQAQLEAFPLSVAELHVITLALPRLNHPGLLVMDMDSTAIQIECIDELAAMAGVGERVAAITERAMQGELDFEQSLRQRVAQLKGADANIISTLCANLPLMSGLEPMLVELKSHGWRLVVASGGFTPFVGHLKQLLSLDAAFANELVITNGKLAGEVTGKVVDAQFKADVVERCSEQWNIAKGQRVAIGDGANDIPMVMAADFGIAFHAKPKLAAAADANIRQLDLRVLPYLLQM
ncbi:phosphoserine phosphatase [Shewanella morhuae]|uniref:phosphoserine phosphatase SerB n=1 Tax=Shewanella morhuae TaxID=365591 RepID=UPI000955DC01|nr:phosphoserine phosphatase SerB [Shewanella morhuae]SIQ44056.1 phosphoserine phosphatase [Shewanella morhuae]